MTLSERLRRSVRERAKNRCEYCLSHQDYIMGWLQVDHILPVAKGGANTADNLCLACELCNQYKWIQTEAIDPESQQTAPLYNPRLQPWSEHFRWDAAGVEIQGITAVGRATVLALQLNNPLALTVRRNWVRAGWHPPFP
ncbi:MAG: HNH endonuclease [Prochlorothrix sp.]